MTAIDILAAKKLATDIVHLAGREGKLEELSKNKVRNEVEQKLKLEEGTLSKGDYKKALNEAISAAVEEVDAGGEPAQPAANEKQRKDAKTKTKSPKAPPTRKRKSTEANGNETARNSKKAKVAKVKEKETVDEAGPPAAAGKKKVSKAKAVVVTDDEGQREDPSNATTSSPKTKKPTSPGERKERAAKDKSQPDNKPPASKEKAVGSEKPSSEAQKPSSSPKESTTAEERKPVLVSLSSAGVVLKAADVAHEASDSELSVLVDEPPPTKKRKTITKASEKEGIKETGSKSRGKAPKDVSPDEETIKKLKGLVVACGVRKVWSKELKELDTPTQQIKHLRAILSDLGMKGRFSMEQARAIKLKRELAQEIDDVREFAKKHAKDGRPSRSNTAKSAKGNDREENVSDDGNESESEEGTTARRRKSTAHRSIMAFLEDQSE